MVWWNWTRKWWKTGGKGGIGRKRGQGRIGRKEKEKKTRKRAHCQSMQVGFN
jgi:hypothetical protein